MAGDEDAHGAGQAPTGAGPFPRPSLADLEAAQAALAPAFALGLQQALESPARWADLSRAFLALTSERDEKASGERFVHAIFGAPGLEDAILRQASATSGLAAPILSAVMPFLAAAGAQAMLRAATGGSNASGGLPGVDDLGRITAEMMRRSANAVEALSRPSSEGRPAPRPNPMSPTGFFDAFGEAMRMASTAGPTPASAVPSGPVPPFAAMFDAFARGMRTAAGTSAGSTQAGAAPSRSQPDPNRSDAFARSQTRLPDDAMREMAALFQRFMPPGEGKV